MKDFIVLTHGELDSGTDVAMAQEVEGYIWCDEHGGVHEASPDPYQAGEHCSDWRKLYMEPDL